MFAWWLIGSWSVFLLITNSALGKANRCGPVPWALSTATVFMLVCGLALRGDKRIDWDSYQELYASMPSITWLLSGGDWLPLNIEPGYQLYMSVFKFLNMHPNWLPTGLFLLTVAIVLRSCRRLKVPPMPMVAMIALLIYPHFFEQMRMAAVYMLGVAVGIAILHNNCRAIVAYSLIATSVQYIGLAYIFSLCVPKITAPAGSAISYLDTIRALSTRKKVAVITALLCASAVAYRFSEPLLSATMQPFLMLINPVSEKLTSYYERREELAVSFSGAAFLVFSGMSLVWLSNRMDMPHMRRVMFGSGIVLFLAVIMWLATIGFPVLSHRILGMFVKPTLAILISHVALNAKRQGWLYILLSIYAVYCFRKITNEVGPYE